MDISTYVSIGEKSGPIKKACRPLLESLVKKTDDDLYAELLVEYPQWFVTDTHKRLAFPDRKPNRVSDREVADSYLEAVEEAYIHCMLYVVATGILTISWYALLLLLMDYLFLDLSWAVVGVSYSFLGTLMVARLKVGPSHLTVQMLTDAHEDPLLLIVGERITRRLKEHLGLLVLAGGFLITFMSESGILSMYF